MIPERVAVQRCKLLVFPRIVGFPVILLVTACTLLPTPTPTATSTPTFLQQRTGIVSFLKQLNQVDKNFADALESVNLEHAATSGDEHQMDVAFRNLVALLEGNQQQLRELAPPSGIREAQEIKRYKEQAITKFFEALLQVMEGVADGRLAETNQAIEEMNRFPPAIAAPIEKASELQEWLLARYNIPDVEVGYLRQ